MPGRRSNSRSQKASKEVNNDENTVIVADATPPIGRKVSSGRRRLGATENVEKIGEAAAMNVKSQNTKEDGAEGDGNVKVETEEEGLEVEEGQDKVPEEGDKFPTGMRGSTPLLDVPVSKEILQSDGSPESKVGSSRAVSPTDSLTSGSSAATVKNEDFSRNLDVEINLDEDSNSMSAFGSRPQTPFNAEDELSEEKKLALADLEAREKAREERFAKLEALLRKSSCYSKFLLTQVEKQMEIAKKKQEAKKERILAGKNKRKRGAPARVRKSKKAKVVVKEEENDDEEAPEEEPEAAFDGTLKLDLFKGELRDYQVEGVNWMASLYAGSTSGILGDEMGLGKTVQVIAAICHLVESDENKKPYLIIVPLSTLTNWVMEFQRFAPEIPFIIYHGNKDERAALLPKAKIPVKIPSKGYSMKPVLLTTYETVVYDQTKLNRIEFTSMIIDEGHRLKNHEAALSKVVRTIKSDNRFLLTGTPLQNNMTELWALLNFLMPELFTNLEIFNSWFDPYDVAGKDGDEVFIREQREKQLLTKFQEIISPFMMRRVKTECGLSLPPKREILIKCSMTPRQLKMYESVLDYSIIDWVKDNKTDSDIPVEYKNGRPVRYAAGGLLKADYSIFFKDGRTVDAFWEKIANIMEYRTSSVSRKDLVPRKYEFDCKMQSPMMQLQKCSCHPYLLAYPLTPAETYHVDEDIIKSCGKMLMLDRLLTRLLSEGHKVLLFSHFKIMLNILQDYMCFKDIPFVRLDGSMKLSDRAESIRRFNEDPNMNVFLLSTRAGGLGLNLMAADTVIIYDSDWNPQADLQAQDRAHRIGQTKPVLVFRMVTLNTVEEVVMARAAAKRKIEAVILGSGNFNVRSGPSKSEEKDLMEDVRNRLKQLNMGAVMKTEQNCVSDEELDAMLDRTALSKPEMTNATEKLEWQHEYIGPCQIMKEKNKEKKKNKALAKEKGKESVFEVLVDHDDTEGIAI